MWFDLNFWVLILENTPTFKRTSWIPLFAKALLAPLIGSHYNWLQFRKDNIYIMTHTGQVCYMRKALNDRFDKILRRIYIGDGQTNETTYIYTDAEDQDEYLDDTIWLYTEAETADTGLDFIVYVPEEIYTNQIHALHSLIKLYKAGGKRYAILTI